MSGEKAFALAPADEEVEDDEVVAFSLQACKLLKNWINNNDLIIINGDRQKINEASKFFDKIFNGYVPLKNIQYEWRQTTPASSHSSSAGEMKE